MHLVQVRSALLFSQKKAFEILPKRECDVLQSDIFPVHFFIQAVARVFLMMTTPRQMSITGSFILGGSQLAGFFNFFCFTPASINRESETSSIIYSDYNADGEKVKIGLNEKNKSFAKYHGISIMLDMVGNVSLTAYGFTLCRRLRVILESLVTE